MIKLVILDVDGVMCSHKTYNEQHEVVSKQFCDLDFTAIKRFQSHGIMVVMLSGDKWNEGMAKKRDVKFYHNRIMPKEMYVGEIQRDLGMNLKRDAIYVGDDIYDVEIMQHVYRSYCPSNSPHIVRQAADVVLSATSGNGCVAEVYDHAVEPGA